MASRQLPPLNALRCFEAAARLGSFNKAAKELFVTPSAVSHQVKTLENYLALKLFVREKRTVKLTLQGSKYLASITHALDEIDAATRRIKANPSNNIINLSAAPAFLTRWLVPRLGQFQNKHPEIELRVSAAVGEIDFQHTDTDLAIYLGDGNWPQCTSYFLMDTVVVPVCSPRLLEDIEQSELPIDLEQMTLIHVSSRADEWPDLLEKNHLKIGKKTKSITFSSTSLALGAAMEGVGIALSDLRLVERELQFKQLVTPFEIQMETNKSFYLVHPKERQLNQTMLQFKDWLLAELTNTQHQG